MAVIKTPRHDLETYTDGEDAHPGRETFNAEVAKLEAMPAVKQGSTGSRPVSGVGKVLYWDEAAKRFQYDDGTDWQDVAPIGGVTPSAVAVAGAASEGVSPRAARGDHTHPLPLATSAAHGAMSADDKKSFDERTALPTAGTVMLRSAQGRSQVAGPAASDDVANKKYVDDGLAGKSATTHSHVNATPTAPGFMTAADKAKLDVIAVIGDWINLVLGNGFTASTALPPKYRITGDHIEFRGAVIASDPTKKTVMSNLPASVRPAANFNVEFLADSSVTGLNGQVTVAGELVLTTPVAGKYYGLENIHWFF